MNVIATGIQESGLIGCPFLFDHYRFLWGVFIDQCGKFEDVRNMPMFLPWVSSSPAVFKAVFALLTIKRCLSVSASVLSAIASWLGSRCLLGVFPE